MADEACSSKAIRAYLRDRGIQCIIPGKEDQKANWKRKGSAGDRPMRYDKLALTYRSEAVLQAVFIWSTTLGDTSWP